MLRIRRADPKTRKNCSVASTPQYTRVRDNMCPGLFQISDIYCTPMSVSVSLLCMLVLCTSVCKRCTGSRQVRASGYFRRVQVVINSVVNAASIAGMARHTAEGAT